jgi:hypothetical protein
MPSLPAMAHPRTPAGTTSQFLRKENLTKMFWQLAVAIALCALIAVGLTDWSAQLPEYHPQTAKMAVTPAMRKWIENAPKF